MPKTKCRRCSKKLDSPFCLNCDYPNKKNKNEFIEVQLGRNKQK